MVYWVVYLGKNYLDNYKNVIIIEGGKTNKLLDEESYLKDYFENNE